MNKEISTLKRKRTFIQIRRSFVSQNKEILPLIWVFKYKLDQDGYLLKYKARLCARGDLQTT